MLIIVIFNRRLIRQKSSVFKSNLPVKILINKKYQKMFFGNVSYCKTKNTPINLM